MLAGGARKEIHPEAALVKGAVSSGIAGKITGNDGLCRELATAESVEDSLSSEWLHHARDITDQEQPGVQRADGLSGERGDGAPRLTRAEAELRFRPRFDAIDPGGKRDEAEIGLPAADIREAAVAIRQKAHDDLTGNLAG